MSLSLASSKQVIAEVVTRPLRFGYIVNRDIDYLILQQVFQYNSSLWGGRYNLFVPSDGHTVRNDWLSTLLYHDPDIILLVGDIDDQLVQTIYELILPMNVLRWEVEFDAFNKSKPTAISPVMMDTILESRAADQRKLPNDDFHLRYIVAEGKYSRFIETETGIWLPETKYREYAQLNCGVLPVTYSPNNLDEYLDMLDNLERFYSPLALTTLHLQVTHNLLSFVPPRLIISSGMYDDLFIRFASTEGIRNAPTVIIPIGLLHDKENYRLLANWYGSKIRGNKFELVSFSLSLDELSEIRNQLRQYLPQRPGFIGGEGWSINISRCNLDINYPTVFQRKQQQQINIVNRRFSFLIPKPAFLEPFGFRYRDRRWINDIDLTPNSRGDGFLPSMFRDLNFIMSGYQDRQWLYNWGAPLRIARGKLATNATLRNDVSIYNLPSDNQIIRGVCENSGFEFKLTNQAYYGGLVSLLGTIEEARFLQHKQVRELFSSKPLLAGNAWTFHEMRKQLHVPKEEITDFKKWIAVLASKGILLRGYNLECQTCGLETWYELSRITEHIICEGCRLSFQIPLHLDFAYRLNRLFMDRQSQGTVTVLLTLLMLKTISKHSLHWQADITLAEGDVDTEIDIIAMCDGCLLVIECKNSFIPHRKPNTEDSVWQKQLDEAIDTLKTQISKEIALAIKLHAHLFIFATLEPNIPQEILEYFEQQRVVHSGIGIRIVSANELSEGRLFDGKSDDNFVSIGELARPYMIPARYNDEDCSLKEERQLNTYSFF